MIEDLQVFILVGGRGTRLQSVVSDLPKPMAPIGDKPFLHFLVSKLVRGGIKKICFLTGYKHDSIENYIDSIHFNNVEFTFSREMEPLGTGGAIRQAVDQFPDHEFLVVNGDTFFNFDIELFVDEARSRGAEGAVALRFSEDMSRYGAVDVSETFTINKFVEKDSQRLSDGFINAGTYYFKRQLLEEIAKERCSLETSFLPKWASQERLLGVPMGGGFIDIGIPEDYFRAQDLIGKWLVDPQKRALFLDRDGILVEDVPYLSNINDIRVMDTVVDALKVLMEREVLLFVTTNQAGIAKGKFTLKNFEFVQSTIEQILKQDYGIQFDETLYCPYHEEGAVEPYNRPSYLRKPWPGMHLKILDEYNVDIKNSLMIGDKDSDIIRLPGLKHYLLKGNYPLASDPQIIRETQSSLAAEVLKFFK